MKGKEGYMKKERVGRKYFHEKREMARIVKKE